jgi:predicted PurR-regulated permease PerM
MYSLERYRKIAFGITSVVLVIACVVIAVPMWPALVWGAALAILVYPHHARMRARMPNTVSAAIATFATLLFIIVPIALIFLAFIAEARIVSRQLQQSPEDGRSAPVRIIEDAERLIQPVATQLGLGEVDLHETLTEATSRIGDNLPTIIRSGLGGAMHFILAFILIFFTLRDVHRLEKPTIELMPVPKERARAILRSVYDTVHATFYSTVVVAIIQGTLLGFALWFLGLPAPLLWGVIGAVLSMIPFIGTPFVWVPAALLLAAGGGWVEAIGLVLFGAFVIGLVDNVLKPLIIGARVKLHPIAVFFAILGSILAVGPVGVIVGPVLLSVVLGAISVLREMPGLEPVAEA